MLDNKIKKRSFYEDGDCGQLLSPSNTRSREQMLLSAGHIHTAPVARYVQADAIPPSLICQKRQAHPYLFLYVCGGHVIVKIDDQTHHMNPGDALLLPPNQIYEIGDVGSRSTDLFVAAFSLSKHSHLYSQLQCPCMRRDMHRLISWIEKIDYDQCTRAIDDPCADALLLLLLDEFVNAHELLHEGEYLFRLAAEYIRKHVREVLTPDSVSFALRYHKNYLARAIKTYAGMTLFDMIVRAKVHAARNYLAFTTYSLEKTAKLLAFSSASSFARFFQYRVGVTPAKYRRMCQNAQSASMQIVQSEN